MVGTFRGAYEILWPGRIVFGWGRRRELGALARSWGRRAFLVLGSRALETSGVFGALEDLLRGDGVEPIPVGTIHREPIVEDVDAVSSRLRDHGAGQGDVVVGIGGGSAMDVAKAAAALATQSGSPSVMEYLEGVGSGRRLETAPLPFIAVPTTAGTGSEATKNAVISRLAPPFKKSMRSDAMVARAVLVDPELTVSVPPAVTAATGMDALTQLMESYVSCRASPIPQAIAIQGVALVGSALERAYAAGDDQGARERMAHAALLSGIALANSGLGLAHGVAASLGVHAGVPHGVACAVMLPAALRANLRVREAEIAELGEALSGRSHGSRSAGASAAVDEVQRLCEALRIPTRLRDLGVRSDQLDRIVEGSHGNSLKGNPREVSDEELRSILESML